MPLQFDPGEEAQVDWHEGWIFENGCKRSENTYLSPAPHVDGIGQLAVKLFDDCRNDLQREAFVDQVLIWCDQQLVAVHERCYIPGQFVLEPLSKRVRLDLSNRPELVMQGNGVRDTGIYDRLKAGKVVLV